MKQTLYDRTMIIERKSIQPNGFIRIRIGISYPVDVFVHRWPRNKQFVCLKFV